MRGSRVKLAGTTQGSLTIIRDIGKDNHGSRLWECQCACGVIVIKSANALRNGAKYCGMKCSGPAGGITRMKHGLHRSKEYRVWQGIRQRCNNPDSYAYKGYGGRGISMHPAWEQDFELFLADVGFSPSKEHSLDRIDNNRGYEPDNVRWATRKEQSNNTRSNVRDVINGVEHTLAEIADTYGIKYHIVAQRYRRGLRGSELIQKAIKSGRKPTVHITYKGTTLCLTDWSIKLGIPKPTLLWRLNQGWSVEEILNGRN